MEILKNLNRIRVGGSRSQKLIWNDHIMKPGTRGRSIHNLNLLLLLSLILCVLHGGVLGLAHPLVHVGAQGLVRDLALVFADGFVLLVVDSIVLLASPACTVSRI